MQELVMLFPQMLGDRHIALAPAADQRALFQPFGAEWTEHWHSSLSGWNLQDEDRRCSSPVVVSDIYADQMLALR
jgi:hypothetical protein